MVLNFQRLKSGFDLFLPTFQHISIFAIERVDFFSVSTISNHFYASVFTIFFTIFVIFLGHFVKLGELSTKIKAETVWAFASELGRPAGRRSSTKPHGPQYSASWLLRRFPPGATVAKPGGRFDEAQQRSQRNFLF